MQITTDTIDSVHDEAELIESLLGLDHQTLLELGCGSAALTRRLATGGSGRKIIATEVDEQAHSANCAIDDLPNVEFHLAGAQAIPAADASVDTVFMFKSLHHVPLESMDAVFDELRRVLRPGGHAWISEPIFAGAFNEVLRLFHDEQAVREAAFAATQRAVAAGKLVLEGQHFFLAPMHFTGFADFERKVIGVTHTSHRLSAAQLAAVESQFNLNLGEDGAHFQMPMRVDLLRR